MASYFPCWTLILLWTLKWILSTMYASLDCFTRNSVTDFVSGNRRDWLDGPSREALLPHWFWVCRRLLNPSAAIDYSSRRPLNSTLLSKTALRSPCMSECWLAPSSGDWEQTSSDAASHSMSRCSFAPSLLSLLGPRQTGLCSVYSPVSLPSVPEATWYRTPLCFLNTFQATNSGS